MVRLTADLQCSVGPARRARGWTQKDLARAAGVSRQTIVELEQGNYNPSTALALRLAVLLETAVDELFQLTEAEVAGLEATRASHAAEGEGSDGTT
jgi:putative transcriptional regulator